MFNVEAAGNNRKTPSTQTQRSYRVIAHSHLVAEDLETEPAVAKTPWVSAQTPPWLGDVLLCTPRSLSLLAEDLSRDMPPVHKFRWLSECWDPVFSAGSSNTWLKSGSWSVLPPLPKHKHSHHVTVWNKHFNGSSFRGLPATWLNTPSRHMRFYRWKSSQASICFLPASQEPLFRMWDWDTPSSNSQSQFLSRIHMYLPQFKNQISDVGLQPENHAEEAYFRE